MARLILIFASYFAYGWSPSSWRHLKSSQIPNYKSEIVKNIVQEKLAQKTPLVISEEIDALTQELERVGNGEKFLLMGGDCAETFREHSTDNIILNYQLFILSTIMLMKNTGLNVVKIARMAGQFSKPRSENMEIIEGNVIHSYKGDMINREDPNKRDPDPRLMLKAYEQSAQTMNLLRALSNSNFSNINLDSWITSLHLSNIQPVIEDLQNQFKILKACGIEREKTLNSAVLYTGHEGLLLPYEEAFTRVDRYSGLHYDCSSHFQWIGERTRDLDEAHVEFFRGVNNPIGIKISDKIEPSEFLSLLDVLNPANKMGRITVITRMGKKIERALPELIDTVEEHGKKVVWVCDPMHGNGAVLNGRKTRYFDDILQEVESFFQIHKEKRTVPGGIHLEMTGKYVTECTGGSFSTYKTDYDNFETSCDPRLNMYQTIELIEKVSKLI